MGKGLRGLLLVTVVMGFLVTAMGLVFSFGAGVPRAAQNAAPLLIVVGSLVCLTGIGAWLTLRARLVADYRVALLQVLAAAVRRGLPPAQALSAFAADYDRPLRLRTWAILNEIDRGLPLAGALEKGGRGILSPQEIGALHAAEGGPRLGAVLEGLVAREVGRRSSVDGTARRLLYPAVVLGIAALTAIVSVGRFHASITFFAPTLGLRAASESLAALAPALALRAPAAALALLALGGALLLLLREGRRRRLPPFRGILERAALRPGGGLLPLDRAELLCRALEGASAAGLPLEHALERAAEAGGSGAGGRAVREAAEEARRGSPPERVFAAARLPRRVALRLAAAAHGTPESFGEAAAAMAVECGRLRRDRAALLAAAIHPVTLVLGGIMAIAILGGLLSAYHRMALSLVEAR